MQVKINSLYQPKKGTHFVVRVIDKRREMLAGEAMDNPAKVWQVGLQRQYLDADGYFSDIRYSIYTVELETFLNEYEEIK